MKKYYKLTLKNYILITLYIISILLLISECNDFTTLIITKIIGLIYFGVFSYTNLIRNTQNN